MTAALFLSPTPPSPDVALTLTEHVAAAYCDRDLSRLASWNCTRCSDRTSGFVVSDVVHDEANELVAYAGTSPRLRSFLVVFRGTKKSSIGNWVDNLHIYRRPLPYAPAGRGATVHAGFLRLYEESSVRERMLAAVASRPSGDGVAPVVRVVGHSLGGALATLLALELASQGLVPPASLRLFTVGSPRVGNAPFVRYLWSHLAGRSLRVTNGRDLVPTLPPRAFGYRHVPSEVWHVGLGHERKYRVWVGCNDTSGAESDPAGLAPGEEEVWEDPSCQMSVCEPPPAPDHAAAALAGPSAMSDRPPQQLELGRRCLSVSDHLHYLLLNTYEGDGSIDC